MYACLHHVKKMKKVLRKKAVYGNITMLYVLPDLQPLRTGFKYGNHHLAWRVLNFLEGGAIYVRNH